MLLLTSVLVGFSCGCGQQAMESQEPVSSPIEIDEGVTSIKTNEKVILGKIQPVIFQRNDKSYLMSQDQIYGVVRLNRIEKLGIWDWMSSQVSSKGIKNSYSINMSLDCSSLLAVYPTANIKVTAKIKDRGDYVSSACMLGWTGFPEKADLYDNHPKATIEIGTQPTVTDFSDDAVLELRFEDTSNSIDFEPIYYDISCLKNAEKGATIKSKGDKTVIKSVNGGEYEFSFDRVEANYRHTNVGREEYTRLYDIEYTIKYTKKPTTKQAVATFDTLNSSTLNPALQFDLYQDVSEDCLSTRVPEAVDYIDRKYVKYLTPSKGIKLGKSVKYKTNILIPNNVARALNYVRIIIQFPDEQVSSTEKQRINFNGRYVVYQMPLSVHSSDVDDGVYEAN
jgi:hypothetical protein